MKPLASILAAAFAFTAPVTFTSLVFAEEIELKIIHMGDVHGHPHSKT